MPETALTLPIVDLDSLPRLFAGMLALKANHFGARFTMRVASAMLFISLGLVFTPCARLGLGGTLINMQVDFDKFYQLVRDIGQLKKGSVVILAKRRYKAESGALFTAEIGEIWLPFKILRPAMNLTKRWYRCKMLVVDI